MIIEIMDLFVKNILPSEGIVNFFPDFFTAEESDRYFNLLLEEIAWKQEPVRLMGKMVMQPRLTAWYGDPGKHYRYSGITMTPTYWTPALQEIRQRIETVSPVVFNSALLNQYRDNKDSMGWHRDNEKSLGTNPVIGSVSFGATRTFRLRHFIDKERQVSLELTNGSFLLMCGQTQHLWEHCVPKRTRTIDARINITFRVIK